MKIERLMKKPEIKKISPKRSPFSRLKWRWKKRVKESYLSSLSLMA